MDNTYSQEISVHLSQNVEKLLNVTSKDFKECLKYYSVTEAGLKNIVQSIQEWYKKQPHLPEAHLDERYIIGHLILKAFSIGEVKDKIDNCISAKHKLPELLLLRDPTSPQIDKYLRFGFFLTLPSMTISNHRVLIFRIQKPIDFNVPDVIKMSFMLLEYRIWNDVSLGEHWILDLSNVTFQNAVQMTPMQVVKMIYYLRFCFGTKIKGIHLVNTPNFVSPILKLVKKVMIPKVARRVGLYENFEELHKVIPKHIFPKEYGGEAPSCQEIAEEWRKTIQTDAWRRYFLDQDQLQSDESKRIRKLCSDGFFGADGSFRKLEID